MMGNAQAKMHMSMPTEWSKQCNANANANAMQMPMHGQCQCNANALGIQRQHIANAKAS